MRRAEADTPDAEASSFHQLPGPLLTQQLTEGVQVGHTQLPVRGLQQVCQHVLPATAHLSTIRRAQAATSRLVVNSSLCVRAVKQWFGAPGYMRPIYSTAGPAHCCAEPNQDLQTWELLSGAPFVNKLNSDRQVQAPSALRLPERTARTAGQTPPRRLPEMVESSIVLLQALLPGGEVGWKLRLHPAPTSSPCIWTKSTAAPDSYPQVQHSQHRGQTLTTLQQCLDKGTRTYALARKPKQKMNTLHPRSGRNGS